MGYVPTQALPNPTINTGAEGRAGCGGFRSAPVSREPTIVCLPVTPSTQASNIPTVEEKAVPDRNFAFWSEF